MPSLFKQIYLLDLHNQKKKMRLQFSIFLWKERNSKVVHRVHVKSQPLNVVYNSIVIKFVTEFLTILDDVNTASYCQIKSKLKLLHSAMYDTYNVDLNNIVGCVKNNRRGAHLKGNSSLYMVDGFSISLNIERRTVETNDLAWPILLVTGTLPGLRLHFNEVKLATLKHVLVAILRMRRMDNWQYLAHGSLTMRWVYLLVAHFCVNDLSIELQSSGKQVAEVQVTNM